MIHQPKVNVLQSRFEKESSKLRRIQTGHCHEHDFSALKRARMYAKPGTALDEIIRDYGAV